jgi:hypothetical protein
MFDYTQCNVLVNFRTTAAAEGMPFQISQWICAVGYFWEAIRTFE